MNLTFSMLLEKTAEYLHCEPLQIVRSQEMPEEQKKAEERFTPGDLREEESIRQVLLYKKKESGCTDALYICDIPPQKGAANLFCLAAAGPQERALPVSPGVNAAVFPRSIRRGRLFQAACAALAFYQSWAGTILDMIYQEKGLDAIVSFAYETFQNPFLIYDSSLKVLSYTRNDGSTDRLWTDTVQYGAVTDLNEASAREFLLYVEKLDRYDRPFKHTSRDLSDPFYSCNIRIGGRRAGMIALMERRHPVTPGQVDLLLLFAWLLTFELQKDATRRENTGFLYSQLIFDLMEGKISGRDTLLARLSAARWNIDRYIYALRFIPDHTFLSEPEWRRAFDQLLALNLGGRGILLQQSVFYLLTRPVQKPDGPCLDTIRLFCEKYRLRCGISDAYTDILETCRLKIRPAWHWSWPRILCLSCFPRYALTIF